MHSYMKAILCVYFLTTNFEYCMSGKITRINHFIDPCATKKCNTNEICIPGSLSAECILSEKVTDFHFFKKRQIVQREKIARRIFTGQIKRGIISPCLLDICRHGECEIINSTSYKCHCVKGVTSNQCNYLSTTSNPCDSNPCYAQSACININSDKFVCICRSSRSGPTCKGHAAPCQCVNNGRCKLIELDAFTCECPENYGGHLCQYQLLTQSSYNIENIKPLESCTPNTCLNGGTCLDINLKMLCLCTDNFNGPYCNKIIKNELNNKITKNTLTTTKQNPNIDQSFCPSPLKNVCLNGGICRSNPGLKTTFTCECKAGYSGTFCEKKVPFCAKLDRCKNGGTCYQTDFINGKCACSSKFKGLFCEIGLECEANYCRNNQPCLLINGKPKCVCIDGFTGPKCY